MDGKSHAAALRPDVWLPLKLKSQIPVTEKMAAYVFDLPRDSDHTGCLPGQYVAVNSSYLSVVVLNTHAVVASS